MNNFSIPLNEDKKSTCNLQVLKQIPFLQKIKGEKRKRTGGRVAAAVFQQAVAGVGVQNSAIRGQGPLFAGAGNGNTQQDTQKKQFLFLTHLLFHQSPLFSCPRHS